MARGAPLPSGPLRPRHAAQARGRAEADPLVGVTRRGCHPARRDHGRAASARQRRAALGILPCARHCMMQTINIRPTSCRETRRRQPPVEGTCRDLSLARQLDLPARREHGEAGELPSPWPCVLAITPAGRHRELPAALGSLLAEWHGERSVLGCRALHRKIGVRPPPRGSRLRPRARSPCRRPTRASGIRPSQRSSAPSARLRAQ